MEEGMDRRQFLRSMGIAAAAASVGGAALLKPGRAYAQAEKRTVQEFLDAVGKTVIWVPPIRDFWGWINAVGSVPRLAASVDYCGFAADYLKANGVDIGTQVTGTVTERPLKGGQGLVKVELHTINALTWGIAFDPDSTANQFGENELVFGYRAAPTGWQPAGEPDVLHGAVPALAESHLLMEFIIPTFGGALPDVHDWGGWGTAYQIVTSSFRANAVGVMRALSGLPEGTPARCVVTQTGLYKPTPAAKNWDAFPAEKVAFHPIG